ncbi:MAG: hypothetical protein DI637_04955 [Citromicrobium sp.]|nr:MAG: hypothetical protein DI637_04955 [Citromicrobium sp.]
MIRKSLALACVPFIFACGPDASDDYPEVERGGTGSVDDRIAAAKIVVDANGLAVGSGAEREAPRFGSARGEVDALLATAFDQKPEMTSNDECGAGPTDFSQVGPLQVAYQDDRFTGWYLQKGNGVVTADGVATGTAFSALRDERPVQIITGSTLDGEFQYQTGDAGMITGFFQGEPDDGRIVGLSAGMTCFFR